MRLIKMDPTRLKMMIAVAVENLSAQMNFRKATLRMSKVTSSEQSDASMTSITKLREARTSLQRKSQKLRSKRKCKRSHMLKRN